MTVSARDLLSSLVFLSCLYNVLSTSVVETTLNVAGSPASSQATSRMEEGQITTTALSVSDSPRDPGSSSALAPGGSSVVESVVMTTADSISASGTTGTRPTPDPASTTSFSLDVRSPAVSSSTPSSSLVQPTSSVLPSMLTGSISFNNLTNLFTDSRCVCDLHVTSCDLNCCCDLDCLTEELQIFTSCNDIPPQSNNPVCVSADHYIQSQTTFRTELVTRGSSDLLCIFIDNYPGRTEFGSPPDVSSTGVNTILRLYGTPGDTLRARATFSYDAFYKFGDPLQSVYNNSVLGTWTLPVAQNSAFCNRGSAIEFLEDRFSSCQISVADMASICNAMSSINMELYTADYGVLRLPSAALNASMMVPIVVNSVVCRTVGSVDRLYGGGPLTPSVSESRCVNVLKEVVRAHKWCRLI